MLAIESGDFEKFKKLENELKIVFDSITGISKYFLEAHTGRVYAMLGEFKKALIIFERLLSIEEKGVLQVIAIIALHGRTILANQMEEPVLALDYYEWAMEYLKDRPRSLQAR